MLDITKCEGQKGKIDCPYKEKCYRYTAKAWGFQKYFMELPLKNGKCDEYWEENEESILNKTEN
jgi:hypothetical protein